MSANGVDKGIGLEKLCEHLGIDIKDTIAVGDADNDIGIFKKAGLKIAMDNANSNIKGFSDVIVLAITVDALLPLKNIVCNFIFRGFFCVIQKGQKVLCRSKEPDCR